MDPAIERQDLAPPPSPPIVSRGLPVAVLAHVLLAVALAFGVQWKRQPDARAVVPLPPVTAEAPRDAPATATMGGPAGAPQAPPAPARAARSAPGRASPAAPAPARGSPARVQAEAPERAAPAPARERAAAAPPGRTERAPAPQVVARNTAPPAPAAQRVPPAERVSPSFDCDKARSTPEKLICADPELSRLDRDLGRLYARARQAAPDPAAFRRHSDAQWFQRERTCRDRDCLLRWYAQRREQLTAALAESEGRAQR